MSFAFLLPMHFYLSDFTKLLKHGIITWKKSLQGSKEINFLIFVHGIEDWVNVFQMRNI